MVRAVRDRDRGDVETAARCLLAFAGIAHPTPEQYAGALLHAHAQRDLHVLAMGRTYKE